MTGQLQPLFPPAPPAAGPRRTGWRSRLPRSRRGLALLVAVPALLAVGALTLALTTSRSEPPAAVATPPPPRLQARGQVQPVTRSRVGTLGGGVVERLAVEIGQTVERDQEIARVRGAGMVEVLTAPISGTVASLLVNRGDTVAPGTILAVVADLRHLQVETTDVDEFLISRLHRGQAATLTVEALDRRELRGTVQTLAPQPQVNASGDEHYPVVIELPGVTPGLKPGMTVRITFDE